MISPSPAHHIQAQTIARRVRESEILYEHVAALAEENGLPERTTAALFDAAQGLRVRRTSYERAADVEPGTAGRDLRLMVQAGLLVAKGETRGRTYVRGPGIGGWLTPRPPRIVDPYERRAKSS